MKKRKDAIIKGVFLAGIFGLIVYVVIQNIVIKKQVLQNPYQTVATITGIKGCFKKGRCITYKYSYNGETYEELGRVSWEFSNWCKKRRNCTGFQFEITLNKDNPKKTFIEWDSIIKEKKFINDTIPLSV